MHLPDFRLERYFAQHEFTARHLLCASDCESTTVEELLQFEPSARARLMRQELGYTESTGAASLREQIARLYQTISPDEVLTFSGAQEAIFWFMHTTLDRGDHAIVHSPCYQSLFEVARATGADVDRWEANESRAWALDLDQLQAMFRPQTKVVVVNLPHNPTGYLMDHETYRHLHELVAEQNAILFCDEVYRESEYDVGDQLSAACDQGPHAVSLGVMSKTYGLAGLRLGWIATTNRAVYRRMAAMKDYTSICQSGPSQLLAEIALRHRQVLVTRNVALIQSNLELLDQFFARHPTQFSWSRPRAGAIAFPKYLAGDVNDFCARLREGPGVLLAPGTLFDGPGNHFRIGFGRSSFSMALSVLSDFLTSSC